MSQGVLAEYILVFNRQPHDRFEPFDAMSEFAMQMVSFAIVGALVTVAVAVIAAGIVAIRVLDKHERDLDQFD